MLIDFTGLNPMSNGNSLRGRLERQSRIMLIVCVATVCIVTTLVAASTWATKAGAEQTMKAAQQISAAAAAIKAAQP